MLEHDLHPSASKFIASLVKSLQIVCNGQVDFNESIELIGHINVRVDRVHKYNYIVDEHVTKEGNDSTTTFLSNSYHSSPPQKPSLLPTSQYESQSEITNAHQNTSQNNDQPPCNTHTVKVSKILPDSDQQQNKIMVKMEGSDNECMVLPAPSDYEAVEGLRSEDVQLAGTSSTPSGSYELDYGVQHGHLSNHMERKRKSDNDSMDCVVLECSDINTPRMAPLNKNDANCEDREQISENDLDDDKKICFEKLTKDALILPQSINNLREKISNIASMLSLQVVPMDGPDTNFNASLAMDIKTVKKHFMDHMDKDKLQKLKKILKMKNIKRKKQEFKALIAESGLSEDLLRSLFRRKSKSIEDPFKLQRKSLRIRTHERQQKLLEMAESLKRSKGYNANAVVISKVGNKKISLHKSTVSIFSYQTQFLNLENMDDAAEALSGRINKYGRHCDKRIEKKTISTPKCQHLKRKMRHLVSRIVKDINEAGYRVTFSNTIGSDVEFHSAELLVIPIKVDELFPEVKDDPKLEMSEEDYAKHLEREHFMEKQKANEERMKELEVQLTQILSGVDEVLVTKRKRYGPGSAKPTDAERMKLYRKKLKEDPSKYQDYKQKRSLTTKKRRLAALAAKMKDSSAPGMPNNDVNEDSHSTPSLSLPQTVTSVNIHCPQGYVHPSSHQAPTPTVNLLNTAQYVGQVPGMQPGHQHQQTLPYTGEMDIVELIAATHNVQNQHFA